MLQVRIVNVSLKHDERGDHLITVEWQRTRRWHKSRNWLASYRGLGTIWYDVVTGRRETLLGLSGILSDAATWASWPDKPVDWNAWYRLTERVLW